MTHEPLFLANLEQIEATIASICRRHRLRPEDADEFRSHAFVKVIENDYDVLRQFQQRSSLRTYLAVVLQRLFLDFRNSQWGKWRPSAEAKRLGPTAVELERLLMRDALTLDEAIHVLVTSHGGETSADALRTMAGQFPRRIRRRGEGDEALYDLADSGLRPDQQAEQRDLKDEAARARTAIEHALSALAAEDRLIVTLCFWDRLTIAEVARMFNWEQKPLYRRLHRLLATMRASMVAEGLQPEASALLDHLWSDLVDEPETVSAGSR